MGWACSLGVAMQYGAGANLGEGLLLGAPLRQPLPPPFPPTHHYLE